MSPRASDAARRLTARAIECWREACWSRCADRYLARLVYVWRVRTHTCACVARASRTAALVGVPAPRRASHPAADNAEPAAAPLCACTCACAGRETRTINVALRASVTRCRQRVSRACARSTASERSAHDQRSWLAGGRSAPLRRHGMSLQRRMQSDSLVSRNACAAVIT